jgi:hypothetical protein
MRRQPAGFVACWRRSETARPVQRPCRRRGYRACVSLRGCRAVSSYCPRPANRRAVTVPRFVNSGKCQVVSGFQRDTRKLMCGMTTVSGSSRWVSAAADSSLSSVSVASASSRTWGCRVSASRRLVRSQSGPQGQSSIRFSRTTSAQHRRQFLALIRASDQAHTADRATVESGTDQHLLGKK